MKKLLLTLAVILSAISASAENYILYTSSDGNVVYPLIADWKGNKIDFGANIVSNTYEDGQGKILFDGEVTKIGEYAFESCIRLVSVVIPNSVKKIEDWTFLNCINLKSIEIPNSVTEIGDDAFQNCFSLTSIKIPDSVTKIGGAAFIGCTSLTSVEIPNSVTEIGGGAFCECSSLATFSGKFASEDHRCLINDGVLIAFAPAGLTSYVIPNTVTTIGGNVFKWNSTLTSVEIPNTVTLIDGSAFAECSSLTSVVIPNSVTEIGVWAFESCKALTSVVLSSSVTYIGYQAFYDCGNLATVISLNTTPPEFEMQPFSVSTYQSAILKVPAQAVEAYKAAVSWSSFQNIVGLSDDEIESVITGVPTISQTPTLKTQNLFNLQGQKVGEDYKGIVIEGGKKILKR